MVRARITTKGRSVVFDDSIFDLSNYTRADLVAALIATLEAFLADAARGDLHHWYAFLRTRRAANVHGQPTRKT